MIPTNLGLDDRLVLPAERWYRKYVPLLGIIWILRALDAMAAGHFGAAFGQLGLSLLVVAIAALGLPRRSLVLDRSEGRARFETSWLLPGWIIARGGRYELAALSARVGPDAGKALIGKRGAELVDAKTLTLTSGTHVLVVQRGAPDWIDELAGILRRLGVGTKDGGDAPAS